MAALFDIFAALVVALATAVFAHFGVLMAGAEPARPAAQVEREVKRSITPVPNEALIAVVRR